MTATVPLSAHEALTKAAEVAGRYASGAKYAILALRDSLPAEPEAGQSASVPMNAYVLVLKKGKKRAVFGVFAQDEESAKHKAAGRNTGWEIEAVQLKTETVIFRMFGPDVLQSETPQGERAKVRPAAFHTTEPEPCRGCGAPLIVENAWMNDGCPCNTPAGINDANLYRWKLLSDLQQKQSRELAALRSTGGMTNGAKVPEVTRAMEDAGMAFAAHGLGFGVTRAFCAGILRAMLAAAPTQEQSE